MTQSLRIKGEGYNSIFAEWMKATKHAKYTLAKAQAVLDYAESEKAKYTSRIRRRTNSSNMNLSVFRLN